jgi:hypothetical protein
MQIEQALSGFTILLFCTVACVVLIVIAGLLLICVIRVFIITARALLVKIRMDLSEFSDVIGGKTTRKSKVVRIESGRKKCG